ncbi:MAG: Rieske 2Fe-2S domain-containing protein [Deinococcales bacterium]
MKETKETLDCELKQPKKGLSRRDMLKQALATGVVGLMKVAQAAGGASNIQPGIGVNVQFADEEESDVDPAEFPAVGDVLIYMVGEKRGEPIIVADLPDAEGFVDHAAFWTNVMSPDGTKKQTPASTLILARLEPDFEIPRNMQGYVTEEGIVAYSAICTHFHCMVDRINEHGLISCACHGSVYDPKAAAEPVDGPAPYALSMLPIKSNEEGQLVVKGNFNVNPTL